MNPSLQSRLAWRLALVFAAVILATSLALFFRRHAVDTEIPADTLTRLIDHVVAGLSRGSDGLPHLDLDEDDGKFDYAVIGDDGKMLLASANPPAPIAASGGWPEGYFRRHGPAGDRIAAFTHADTALGHVEIRVELDDTPGRRGLGPLGRELRDEMLPILLPTLLAALLIGALTLRGGLRPLQSLAGEAARITPAESERRLPVTGLPRELGPLVRAINAALDRLDQGFRAQRDFTADAAHQLRTPLAILAAHLDTLGDRAVAGPLRDDVARMSRLVEQLLLVAELEALTLKPNERTDLSALAVEVAEAVAPLALARRRSVAVAGAESPVIVHGNHDALHQALRNLAENAVNHTAEATTVEILVGRDPPRLTVRDHGPGVAQADRKMLFQRFWRADRANSRGAGLGLAIVQRIATAHGARVRLEDAAGGGAAFVIEFPAGASAHLDGN
jgi:signal transduction histidine kinase